MSIRMATLEDVAPMLEIYTPFVTNTTVSFETEPPTPEAFARRMAEHLAQCPWLVWEEEGRVLGYAYAGVPFARAAYSWCAEASIYLAAEARGKGIGAQLYTRLEAILRLQGYQVLYAIITEENQASIAFHTHLGFRRVAVFPKTGYKFGRWLDVTWMAKRLDGDANPAHPPCSWRDLPETALEGLI